MSSSARIPRPPVGADTPGWPLVGAHIVRPPFLAGVTSGAASLVRRRERERPPGGGFRLAESHQRPVGKWGFRFPPFPTPIPLEPTKHRGAAKCKRLLRLFSPFNPLLDVPPRERGTKGKRADEDIGPYGGMGDTGMRADVGRRPLRFIWMQQPLPFPAASAKPETRRENTVGGPMPHPYGGQRERTKRKEETRRNQDGKLYT